MSAESWMVLGVAAIAGLFFCGNLWRRASRRGSELESQLEVQTDRAKQLASDLSKESQTRKRLSEELATFRNRADKIKRRKAKTPEQPLGTSARIRDHQEEAERLRLECDRAASECDGLAASIADLERRLASSERALEKAIEPAVTLAPPTASEISVAESARDAAENELASSRERVAKLEDQLNIGCLTEARMRKRMSNQDQLYASVRAELDVKKDRLRTQEEQIQRLQALKVAVVD